MTSRSQRKRRARGGSTLTERFRRDFGRVNEARGEFREVADAPSADGVRNRVRGDAVRARSGLALKSGLHRLGRLVDQAGDEVELLRRSVDGRLEAE